MTISLWPEVVSFINEKVVSGAYPSVNDAVNDILRTRQLDEEIHEAMMQNLTETERDGLRRKIQEGLDSYARGEYTEYNREDLVGYANKVMEETKRRWEIKQSERIK